jgi:hypothetical protein
MKCKIKKELTGIYCSFVIKKYVLEKYDLSGINQ